MAVQMRDQKREEKREVIINIRPNPRKTTVLDF